ncbi:MAG: hypothetical protein VYA39_00060 [Candidatus Thermoplasmatota archaeon]|nr:hypothetical protein [Candidatus Thermoplasmatota archaeon]
MTSITILGDSLGALCAGHHILDASSEAKVCIITDRAEIGLIGEVPGLISSWPPCPPHWISEMFSQTPTSSSTAVRGSWFLKALGIQLSKRGCSFILRTRVTSVTEKEVRFVGAGPLGKGTIQTDHILDLRETDEQTPRWHGFVCKSDDAPPNNISGARPDGTTEVWQRGARENNVFSLQEMTWVGDQPSDYITRGVQLGIGLAQDIVDTIIHPVEQ